MTKYAYANARIRAMLSRLLDATFFSRLLECADVYEMREALKGTPYAEALSALPGGDLDLPALERCLVSDDVNVYRNVAHMLNPPERDFVLLLSERYEIERLKVALRLWHRRGIAGTGSAFFTTEKVRHDIPYDKILAAQTFEEVIIVLDETPYKKPLLKGRHRFKERQSLFYLEAALDVDYYQRLLEASARLSATDRGVSRKLIGIEIDTVNISWLLRLRKYYALAMGEIMEWAIPGGDAIDMNTVRSLYTSNGIGGVVDTVALGPYQRIRDLIDDKAHLLEQFLYEVLLHQIRRILAGFPFTIGTPLGFLILKHHETRQIISLFYAKSLGLNRDDTSALLSLSG